MIYCSKILSDTYFNSYLQNNANILEIPMKYVSIHLFRIFTWNL